MPCVRHAGRSSWLALDRQRGFPPSYLPGQVPKSPQQTCVTNLTLLRSNAPKLVQVLDLHLGVPTVWKHGRKTSYKSELEIANLNPLQMPSSICSSCILLEVRISDPTSSKAQDFSCRCAARAGVLADIFRAFSITPTPLLNKL